MNICMIGTGYVGLVSGACFAEFGVSITCVDVDAAKITNLHQGIMPIYEPGLEELVARNVKAGRLTFTTDLAPAVGNADAVFIAVGTPSRRGDGHADLSYVFAAVRQVAAALKGHTVVVTKSTVPVGTGRQVLALLKEVNPKADVDIASNPEFLREGSAIADFMRPDRVVVGYDSPRALHVLEQLYRPLYLRETPIVATSIEAAEVIKYAANAFLATKITFINEMANLCEAVGADVGEVAKGIGLDGRIGNKFLHAGPGYGGSCFPKDTLALIQTAHANNVALPIVEAVEASNAARKQALAARIIKALGGTVRGKTIALLGLTFKPETDDMRDSPSIPLVEGLLAAGATIKAFDPEGMAEAQKILPPITYCEGVEKTATGADALVLITEWNQFRALPLAKLAPLMRTPIFIDLRNVYKPQAAALAGFTYYSIGRTPALPA